MEMNFYFIPANFLEEQSAPPVAHFAFLSLGVLRAGRAKDSMVMWSCLYPKQLYPNHIAYWSCGLVCIPGER